MSGRYQHPPGQLWSFVGGIFVVAANLIYVALLLRYTDPLNALDHSLGDLD